jgi:hypothetical protein
MTRYIEPDIEPDSVIFREKRKTSISSLSHNLLILLLYFAAVIPHAVRYEIFSNNDSIPYFLLRLLGSQSLLFVVLLVVVILIPTFALYRKRSAKTISLVLALSFIFYCSLVGIIGDKYFQVYVLEGEDQRPLNTLIWEFSDREYSVYQCQLSTSLCRQIEWGIEGWDCSDWCWSGPLVSNN